MDDIRTTLQAVSQDVKEIKEHVVEIREKQAVHNHILEEHQKRSLLLEARVVPIEDVEKFRSKMFSALVGSGGLLGVAFALVKLYQALTG